MEEKKFEKSLLNKIVLIAIFVAIALAILNNFIIYEGGIKVGEAREIMKEKLKPAELQLVKITVENCGFCFDIEKATEELKAQNVIITNEKTITSSSVEGKEFITKYGIKKLPTILVNGELNKSEQLASYFKQKGEIKEDTFIYTSLAPPYFDIQSNRINGLVSITNVVDSSCEKCLDLTAISSSLKEQGVFVQNEKSVEYNSKEGQDLINQFEIKQVPVVLISKEIDYYSDVKDVLIQSGAKEKNGFYAVHSTLPPYRDLSQNKIVGLVDVVYLTNNACSVCYDVSVNRNVLIRRGLTLKTENTYDINSPEGKQLIQKYNINKVPIIILSLDAKYYSSFEQIWDSVGTVEADGWFVMRKPEVIGTYWDLETNRVVGNE
ncbi:MAG: hypothetical protein AABW90_03265 [Nanoarchaeota archaeon]